MSNDNTVIQSAGFPVSDANQQALPMGTQLEGFDIRAVIGVGGFGIVYNAWDRLLERQVALKEYLPASLAQRMPDGGVKVRDLRHKDIYEAGLRSFVNEARLLAQFDHAALVKVYRFWESSGTAYMVMPFYQGVTLKEYVARPTHTLNEDQIRGWLVTLTEALEVMHAQQCYHRDISPENIIIQNSNSLPILLDFGAARRAIGSVSQPFTVILKASYAPIEQYAEVPSMTQGSWTDVYALAAVAHFLITGKTPPPSVGRLVNDSYQALALRHDIPFAQSFCAAIDRALAVQPDERTADMAQFRSDLCRVQEKQEDLLALFEAPRKEPPLVEIAPPVVQRKATAPRRMIWTGMALVLLLLAFFAWWSTAKKPDMQTAAVVSDPLIQDSADEQSPLYPAFEQVMDKADHVLRIEMNNTVLKTGEDLLRFHVQSPVSGFVTVYVLTSNNNLIQLLPNARVPKVQIEADKALTLPPSNEPLQAAGPAGTNQFLVVVTEQPRSHAHLNLQDHYGFGLIHTDRHSKTPATLALEGVSPCNNLACSDAMAAAWFTVEEVD